MSTRYRWYSEPKWTPIVSGMLTIVIGVFLSMLANELRGNGRWIRTPTLSKYVGLSTLSEYQSCSFAASLTCLTGAVCIVGSLLNPHSAIGPLRLTLWLAWTCLLTCLLICFAWLSPLLRDQMPTLIEFAWLTTPMWALQVFFVRVQVRRLNIEKNPPKGFPMAVSVIPTLTPSTPTPPAAKVTRFVHKRHAPAGLPHRSDSSR